MQKNITFGLPRIHEEPGEKRDFLPSLVKVLTQHGAHVVLEEGYGSGIGYSEEAYRRIDPKRVRFGQTEEVFRQDYVLVLRAPQAAHLRWMQPGATLISMLHYPTRPQRVERLRSLGIEAISLDSITDDTGRRLVENLRAVGWNGMSVAMKTLQKLRPDFHDPHRPPIHVTVLGLGAVGSHAAQAAIHYASNALQRDLFDHGVPGVIVRAVDFDLTPHEGYVRELLHDTDILVDATQRPDPSRPVIPNAWLADLPETAVLLDLSVDPYRCDTQPISVKGIEGIPQGNLDQYIFAPDDPSWEQVPECIDKTNRRWAISCYSWPGIYPTECMEIYGKQLRPILAQLLDAGGPQKIRSHGRYFERAIARAMLSRWQDSNGH